MRRLIQSIFKLGFLLWPQTPELCVKTARLHLRGAKKKQQQPWILTLLLVMWLHSRECSSKLFICGLQRGLVSLTWLWRTQTCCPLKSLTTVSHVCDQTGPCYLSLQCCVSSKRHPGFQLPPRLHSECWPTVCVFLLISTSSHSKNKHVHSIWTC